MTNNGVTRADHVFKLLVTGPFAAGKTSLIRSVSQTAIVDTEVDTTASEAIVKARTTVAMDFGTFTTDENEARLLLFGTPGQRRFWFMTDVLKGAVDAVIYVIDARAEETHVEAGAAMRSLLTDLRVPLVVAVNRCDDHHEAILLGRQLGALSSEASVPCQLIDPMSGREVVIESLIAVLDGMTQGRIDARDPLERVLALREGGMTIDELDTLDVLGLAGAFPRPGWVILDAARDRLFTGIVRFLTLPEITVSFDRGRIYVADRVTEPSLGARLVDAGLLTASELERGIIRLGTVEHIGRLFERVPSLDRHAVTLAAEMLTDECVSWLAVQHVSAVEVMPYRQHPSGVLRWHQTPMHFLQPGDPLPAPEPTDEPVESAPPTRFDDPLDLDFDDLIQWDESGWLDGSSETAQVDELRRGDESADRAPADESDLDVCGDLPVAPAPDVPLAPVARQAPAVTPEDFELIWPSGDTSDTVPDLPSAVSGIQPTVAPDELPATRTDAADAAPELGADPEQWVETVDNAGDTGALPVRKRPGPVPAGAEEAAQFVAAGDEADRDQHEVENERTGTVEAVNDQGANDQAADVQVSNDQAVNGHDVRDRDADRRDTNDTSPREPFEGSGHGALAVRRAVATIDTGSLAARRRLAFSVDDESSRGVAADLAAETGQMSPWSVRHTDMVVPIRRSVFDDVPAAAPAPVDTDDDSTAVEEHEPTRTSALRRLIGTLRTR